jgi:hypothetical protein
LASFDHTETPLEIANIEKYAGLGVPVVKKLEVKPILMAKRICVCL